MRTHTPPVLLGDVPEVAGSPWLPSAATEAPRPQKDALS